MMIKKHLTVLLLAAATLTAAAQERTVKRLPEIGKAVEDVEYSTNLTGFWFAVEGSGGYSARINKENSPFVEFDAIAGYRFNDYLRVGAGFGSRYTFEEPERMRHSSIEWSFPLYLDLRGSFIPQTYRNVVPYWSMDVGGTIRDGFMLRPSVGIRVGRQRCTFLLALSYTGQNIKVREWRDYTTYSTDGRLSLWGTHAVGVNRFVSMLSLRLGYEF